MAWLKIETHTPDKPEIYALADMLSRCPEEIFGRCFRLWTWFDRHTQDGNAKLVTSLLLDRITGVQGFADCLVSVGWLEKSEGGYSLPNFDRHNGNTAKTRAETAKRVSEHREKKRICNAETVTSALPREEKIREEVNPLPPTEVGKPEKSVCPDCPAEKIVEAYHRELPTSPRVVILTKSRRGYLKQRWIELYRAGDFKTESEGLDVFATYFQNVSHSKFLTGQTTGRDGKPPFVADLEWLVKPNNFAKVVEGKYA